MKAMAWVQQIQDGSVRWEIEDTAALVKTSLMKGWSDGLRERMLTSRAARAAGLSCVKELPDEFIPSCVRGRTTIECDWT